MYLSLNHTEACFPLIKNNHKKTQSQKNEVL